MSGPATDVVCLDIVRTRLAAAGQADLLNISQLLSSAAYSPYAYFGAAGPSFTEFVPPIGVGKALGAPSNASVRLWRIILGLVGDNMDVPRGLAGVLRRLNSFLDRIQPILDDEDLGALQDMASDVDTINEAADDLNLIISRLIDKISEIGSLIGAELKPFATRNPGQAVPPKAVWPVAEMMLASRTGQFAEALIKRAEASGDDRLKAYAYGWLVAFSLRTCGAPFVNSIVGGPMRGQWWRQRWVRNHIGAWVYGFDSAGANMVGDTPTPPYEDPAWRDLCGAGLQTKIELPGLDPVAAMTALWRNDPMPQILPAEFCQAWVDAYIEVYGQPVLDGFVTPETVNGAYVLYWLVNWFQTSGAALGCNPAPPMAPPDGCDTAPAWTDPATAPSGGSSSVQIPKPSIESDPDVGKIISGVLLALLGAAAAFFGCLIGGGFAIGAGIALIIDGATEIDWQKLRCDIYWYRLTLYNGQVALHEIMTLGAIAYPYARELGMDQTTLQLLGLTLTFDSGKAITKSRLIERFPADAWNGLIPGTWTQLPGGLEADATVGYRDVGYPSFFLSDASANPLANGLVREGGPDWPVKFESASNRLAARFGNAADNAVDLITFRKDGLPDWNLEADRGLAWLTWGFKDNLMSDPVAVAPDP